MDGIPDAARVALPLTPEAAALCLHLQHLSAMLWTDLDENDGRAWPEHFTEGGTFDFNGALRTGREALRAHFAARLAQGPRVTAHLVTNMTADLLPSNRAIVRAHVCTFGGDGAAPLPIALPTLIGRVEDHFEADDRGRWLVTLRRFRPKFYNPEDRVGRRVANA